MDNWPPFDMDPAFIFDVDFGDGLDPEELIRPLDDSEQQPLPSDQTFEPLFSEPSALVSGHNLQMLGFGEQGTQASMEHDWNNPQGYDTQNAERQQPDHPAPLFTPRISAPFQLPIRTNEHDATMAAYHQAVDPTNHRLHLHPEADHNAPQYTLEHATQFHNASGSATALNRRIENLESLHEVRDDRFHCLILPCPHPAGFSRLADLQRHQNTYHLQSTAFWCASTGCNRSQTHPYGRAFPRKDKRNEHERKIHGRVLSLQ